MNTDLPQRAQSARRKIRPRSQRIAAEKFRSNPLTAGFTSVFAVPSVVKKNVFLCVFAPLCETIILATNK